jgi:hypothetical protein
MLENYPARRDTQVTKAQARVLVVAAALEIAKASAAATTQRSSSDKVEDDLRYAAKGIMELADAIQAAIDKE